MSSQPRFFQRLELNHLCEKNPCGMLSAGCEGFSSVLKTLPVSFQLRYFLVLCIRMYGCSRLYSGITVLHSGPETGDSTHLFLTGTQAKGLNLKGGLQSSEQRKKNTQKTQKRRGERKKIGAPKGPPCAIDRFSGKNSVIRCPFVFLDCLCNHCCHLQSNRCLGVLGVPRGIILCGATKTSKVWAFLVLGVSKGIILFGAPKTSIV